MIDKNWSERIDITSNYDRLMETREWYKKIPSLKFKENWEITMVPPFSGATVRFFVRVGNKAHVSCYLDCYDNLGCMGEPYWEIYPCFDKKGERDTNRFLMKQTKKLLNAIEKSINWQLENK